MLEEKMKDHGMMRRVLVGVVAAAVSAPGLAWAQEGTRASQEVTMTGGTLTLLSYLALLVMLLGFLALLASRQRRDRRELEALTRRMDDVLGGEQ